MTDEIKKKLETAKSKEEVEAILADHKDELTDEELEKVAGGFIIKLPGLPGTYE